MVVSGVVRPLVLVFALLLAGLPAAAPLAQRPLFRAGVDLVTFSVNVVDRRGALVTDLTAQEFEIFEDGVPQRLDYFMQGDGDGEVPLHLGLLLDYSGSMDRELELARTASIRFLNLLPEADDITLVDFDSEVRVTRYPQREFPRLVERIRQRKPDGWTAFYDALGVYLDGADLQEGRSVLVMYTDGVDTRSNLRYGELLTMLRTSQVTVYAIGLVQRAGQLQMQARMRLQQIAETTGGQAFFPSRMQDVEAAYERVLADIQGQYFLGYVSTNPAADGTWRRVEVRVRDRDLRIRGRDGYFAPYRTE